MRIDADRLVRFAPFAAPVALLLAGWMFIVRPVAVESARAAQEAEMLRPRLDAIRASVRHPSPEPLPDDPLAAFERAIPATDSSARLLEQLARMASAASATNLLIETGDQVRVAQASPSGPQAVGASPDPRLSLFGAPLAYSPVTMSFDADYARVGDLLWRLRSLATAVEIRSLEIKPNGSSEGDGGGPVGDGRVHVSMTLFAYVRTAGSITPAGMQASAAPGVSP